MSAREMAQFQETAEMIVAAARRDLNRKMPFQDRVALILTTPK